MQKIPPRVVLLTNMVAYQQLELAEAFAALLGVSNVRLIVASSLSDYRKEMGWSEAERPFLLYLTDQEDEAKRWIDEAEVVIHGRFPIGYVRDRINANKLTFAYQERLWKKRFTWGRFVSRLPYLIKNYYSVSRPNYYLLGAGRYVALDLAKIGCFKGRAYKFGYFIKQRPYCKKPPIAPLRIIWCGRLIALKRPQRALELAAFLHTAGVPVHLTMVGDGPLRGALQTQIKTLGIDEVVNLVGWQTVGQVNEHMQQAHVMLMSSDHQEGWGVVINEAVNNGCFVAVCDEVGSAPWLVEHEHTGLIYKDSEFKRLCERLLQLYQAQPDSLVDKGKLGYELHKAHWSAEAAAERLLALSAVLEVGGEGEVFAGGVCSPV